MKHKSLALAVFTIAAATGLAQETLPAAATVLDRYIEATGGKVAWEALRTEVRKGTYELPAAGVKMSMAVWRALPNHSYILMEAPGLGRIEEGSDGATVWSRSTTQGARIKQGAERETSLLAATLNSDLRWREFYPQAATSGIEDVDGQPCYRVELGTAGVARQVRFYSRETGLLVKNTLTVVGATGEVTTETFPGDYRKVNGVLVPFKTRTKVLGQETVLTVESLEFNQEIDPARFALPDDVRALALK